jgi:hypothetical protein
MASAAHADVVYKCVGAGGKVTYSQNPCYGENWQRFGAPTAAEPELRQKPANTKPTSDTERATTKPAPKKPSPAS